MIPVMQFIDNVKVRNK